MNDRPVFSVGLAIALVAAAAGVYLWLQGDAAPIGQVYYKDVQTGRVFTASAEKTPPITSPDGNTAVLVYMFGCGGCDADSRFEGFYLKYEDGLDVYSSDLENWYSARDEEHAAIVNGPKQRCAERGEEAERCLP